MRATVSARTGARADDGRRSGIAASVAAILPPLPGLTRALGQGEDAVGGKGGPLFLEAARPADLQPLDPGHVGQAEVDAKVVLRDVAAAAPHLLDLGHTPRR